MNLKWKPNGSCSTMCTTGFTASTGIVTMINITQLLRIPNLPLTKALVEWLTVTKLVRWAMLDKSSVMELLEVSTNQLTINLMLAKIRMVTTERSNTKNTTQEPPSLE